jgi:peptidoglycan glycosyltransferase
MNKQIRRLGIFLILCYVALFVKLNQIQVFGADALNNDPNNQRIVQREFNRPRGAITSADGALLAQSLEVTDSTQPRQRVYPEKDLFGQVTGFFSTRYGATGVEKTYDAQLTGSTFQQQVRGLGDLFSSNPNVGNVVLSVRKDLQTEARQDLGNREGSVVALDPKTGAILAFWSYPSFDPNLLTSGTAQDMQTAWDLYNLAPGNPLQAKQYQERYFPGSTFKVVTSGIGLQTGKVSDTAPVFPTATAYQPITTSGTPKPVGPPIANFGNETCGGALPQILMVSCNSAFAQMGQQTIGPQDMVAGAQSFGFNAPVPIDLPAAAQSSFPPDAVVDKDPAILAQSSIGQRDVQATPLQMALVGAAVANHGTIETPHVMAEVRDSEGRVVTTYEPSDWQKPMSPESAATLYNDMLGVVNNPAGTGTPARVNLPGIATAGKTGTAQTGTGKTHTWMVAMAGPAGQDPQVVVSVVVLNQASTNDSTGGQIAGPIASKMLTKALQVLPPAGAPAPGTATTTAPVTPTSVTPAPTAGLGGGAAGGNAGVATTVTGPVTTLPPRRTTTTAAAVAPTTTTAPPVHVTTPTTAAP